ncbi:MAG: hypothetical protein MZV70_34620 [Desulfobacterales bacterium]|nr:hypothetical protein [Desulfobacterales bacterium]
MMERRADAAERAVVDVTKAWFMKDRVGEDFGASVISVNPYGLGVRLQGFLRRGVPPSLFHDRRFLPVRREDDESPGDAQEKGLHHRRASGARGDRQGRHRGAHCLAGLCPEGGRHGSVSRAAR